MADPVPGTPFIDRTDLLEMDEINGAVQRMKTRCRVLNVDARLDYRGLVDCLNVARVPQVGERPTEPALSHLALVARKPKVLHDRTSYDVDLEWDHILDGANQNLSNPGFLGTIYGKTKCSVVQKTTNILKKPAGFVGPWDETITVSHKFDRDHKKYANRVIKQGGEVTIYQAQRNLSFSGYYDSIAPWILADTLIGSINSISWSNHGPTEWMCTEVAWEMMRLKPTPPRYKFSFEFQHNEDGWNPTAVFIDDTTGRPPHGLVKGVGYKVVPYHRQVNYNAVFNAFFEGWQQIFFPLLG